MPDPGRQVLLNEDVTLHLVRSPVLRSYVMRIPVEVALHVVRSPVLKSYVMRIPVEMLLLIIIIIIIKEDRQCKAGRERLTPCQSEDPSPAIPTDKKKEEIGNTEEDKKRSEQLGK